MNYPVDYEVSEIRKMSIDEVFHHITKPDLELACDFPALGSFRPDLIRPLLAAQLHIVTNMLMLNNSLNQQK